MAFTWEICARSGNESPRAIEPVAPIGAIEGVEADQAIRGGRMDETTLPHEDADVGIALAHGVEEHEVTGTQRVAPDAPPDPGLGIGGARYEHLQCLVKDIHDQATAIEPAVW